MVKYPSPYKACVVFRLIHIVLAIASLCAADAVAQGRTSEALGSLSTNLQSEVKIVGDWSVLEQVTLSTLDKYDEQGSNSIALAALVDGKTFADFQDISQSLQYLAKLRGDSERFTEQRLIQSGLPPATARTLASRVPRRNIYELQSALISFATMPRGASQKSLATALNSAVRQSASALLDSSVTDNQVRSAASAIRQKTSARTLQTGAQSSPYLAATLSTQGRVPNAPNDQLFNEITESHRVMSKLASDVLPLMSDAAKKQLSSLDEIHKEYVIQGVAADLLRRSDGVQIVRAAKTLTAEQATSVLFQVGSFCDLERKTARQMYQGAKSINQGLQAATDILTSDWKQLSQQADSPSGAYASGGLPNYVPSLSTTVHLLNDLSSFASGGELTSSSLSELGLMAARNLPGSDRVLALASGISQIADGQTSFVSQSQLILGTLAQVTGLQPLKDIQSAFSTAMPLLQAASPLLALAGFASPLGGVSLVGGLLSGGGLFGGGSSDEQALAEINSKLNEINHKLDIVIDRLTDLQRTVTQQHIEVMNALESISFDVNRTRDIIKSDQVQRYSSDCKEVQKSREEEGNFSAILKDKSASTVLLDHFSKCQTELQSLNVGDTKPALTAIANLATADLRNTALDRLRQIALVYNKEQLVAKQNCFTLVLASYNIHQLESDLGSGASQSNGIRGDSLCHDVGSITDLLDSGTLTYFVNLDLLMTHLVVDLGQVQANAIAWNDIQRTRTVERWKNELRLLNTAIGQQALLNGDVATPDWSDKIDNKKDLDPGDVAVLEQNSILAQNAIRYWLQQHLRASRMRSREAGFVDFTPDLQYAFAYNACAPDYLSFLTDVGSYKGVRYQTDFNRLSFRWTASVADHTTDAVALSTDPPSPCPTIAGDGRRWCVAVTGVSKCFSLPTAKEQAGAEFLRLDDLEALVGARNDLLNSLESIDLVKSLSQRDRRLLLDAFAMKWAADKKKDSLKDSTAPVPAVAFLSKQPLSIGAMR